MNKLQFKYEVISRWIESADLKAQIFIGIQIFFIGFVIENFLSQKNISLFVFILMAIFILFSITALCRLYAVVKPRLSNKNFGSKIFFRDISIMAKMSPGVLAETLINENDEEFSQDLSLQIIEISKVCSDKFELLLDAYKFILISLVTGVVVILFLI